jgi:hypothetical protein
MATIRRFEEIEAWQRARQLVREIYLSEKEFGALREAAIEVKRLIGGFMGCLRRSRMKGPKFVRRPNSANTSPFGPATRNSEL